MSNQKRKKKQLLNGVIIALIVLLIGSYFVSKKTNNIDPKAIESVKISEPSSHLKGNLDSEIKLIEYSDFQCPACSVAEPQIKKLVEEFGDKFQLEYRSFPLRSIHPNAQIGAQAAEAAGMQGKFWEMHDKLFENQAEWSKSFNPKKYLKQYAKEIGINVDRFIYDLESDKVKGIVNAQFDEAMNLELPGTPSFVFNGEKVNINNFINDYLIDKTDKEIESKNKTKQEKNPDTEK